MGVEPEHEERAADLGGVARHAGNAAHRQAVVAAEKDRKPAAPQRPVARRIEGARPAGDLGGVAGRARETNRRVGDRHDIAAVDDRVAERGEVASMPATLSAAGPMTQPRRPAPASTGAPISSIVL